MTASCWRMSNCTERFTIKIFTLIFLCIWLCLSPLPASFAASSEDSTSSDPDFPLYPSIKPNVEFWIDIFTKFSGSQGVIHDTKNLEIVYEVVRLDEDNTAKANAKNQKIKKAVIRKYKNILLHLSTGATPVSNEEKRVAARFGSLAKRSDFKDAAFNLRCQTGLKNHFKDGLIRSGAVIDEFKKTFLSHGLPVDLVYLPCVESSYNFKAYSKFGAAGIWQFTHSTGRQYMKINYVVDERRDPYISTDAAARLLKKNYGELKNWPMAITAYNHGLAGMMRAKKAKGGYEKIFQSYRSRSFKFASRNFYSEFLAARTVAKNHDKYFGSIVFQKPVTFRPVKTKGYLSVSDLSKKLNITLEDIEVLNPSLRKPVFSDQKYIPEGFTLKLPEHLAMDDINKRLASLYLAEQKPSLFHRVQKGDTAGSISRLHSVSLKDLISANGLNARADIYIGQNLRVPAKDKIILAAIKPETARTEKQLKKKDLIKKDGTKQKTAPSSPEPPVLTESPAEPESPAPPKVTDSTQPLESPAKPITEETFINPNIVTGNLKVLQVLQKENIGVIKVEAEETLGHYADWLGVPTRQIRSLNKLKYGAPISVDQEIKLPIKQRSIQDFEGQRYEFHKEIEEDFFESFIIQGFDIYEVKKGDTLWFLCIDELETPVWLLKKYNPEMNFSSLFPGQKIKYPLIAKVKDD